MPVMRGIDKEGPYFKYGAEGKKYHYKAGDKSSMERARNKAEKQGRAIEISRHKK